MKRAIEFITNVMGRYSDCVERNLIDIGEYMTEITEGIVKCGKYIVIGLAIIIGYLLLAVTMPFWYLPYKYFKRKKKA